MYSTFLKKKNHYYYYKLKYYCSLETLILYVLHKIQTIECTYRRFAAGEKFTTGYIVMHKTFRRFFVKIINIYICEC